MTMLIQIFFFLLGMGLCVQLAAALFGLIDCRYAMKDLYPKVAKNILLWSVVMLFFAWLAGKPYRPAFMWGAVVFVIFHIASYAGIKAFMSIRARI